MIGYGTLWIVQVVDLFFWLLELLILARVLLSWLPIRPWHPIARWVHRLADPILRPFQRIMPGFGGIDFSPLLALATIYILQQVVDQLLVLHTVSLGGAILGVVRQVALGIIIFFAIVVLVRLLFSFFHADPWHPLVMAVRRFSDPVVHPFASLLPRTPGFDAPTAVAFLVLLVLYFVVRGAFNALGSY